MRNFNILLTYIVLHLLEVPHLSLSAVIISVGYLENIREQRRTDLRRWFGLSGLALSLSNFGVESGRRIGG